VRLSAILVVSTPQKLPQCSQELEALPGIEVYYSYPESGRIIAIQETQSVRAQEENLRQIQSLPSVLGAQLICYYHDADLDASTAGIERNLDS